MLWELSMVEQRYQAVREVFSVAVQAYVRACTRWQAGEDIVVGTD